jgi:hypothetical protein
MMNVSMNLRDMEYGHMNCYEMVQGVILEMPGCIVMVVNALIP